MSQSQLIRNARTAREQAVAQLQPLNTVIQTVYILSSIANEKGEAVPVDQGCEAFKEALERYTDNPEAAANDIELNDETMEFLEKSIKVEKTTDETTGDQTIRIMLQDGVIERAEEMIADSMAAMAGNIEEEWIPSLEHTIGQLKKTELAIVEKGLDADALENAITQTNESIGEPNNRFSNGVLDTHRDRLEAMVYLLERMIANTNPNNEPKTFMQLDADGMPTQQCASIIQLAQDAGVNVMHMSGANDVTVNAQMKAPAEGTIPDTASIRRRLTELRRSLTDCIEWLNTTIRSCYSNMHPLMESEHIDSIADLAVLSHNWTAAETMIFGFEQTLAHYMISIEEGIEAINQVIE